MKKITLALTLLLVMCALGFAEVFEVTGSSTLEWGYAGTITDNSANYAGEIPTGDLYTDDSGENSLTPNEITLTMEVADEDGMVIVTAESTLDLEDWALVTDEEVLEDAFDFIEFPNVIPGMLGILLGDSDGLSTSVTATDSSTESPRFVATLTPIEGLTAELGFVMDQEELDYVVAGATSSTTTAVVVAIPTGTTYTGTGTTYDLDADSIDDIAIEETTTAATAADTTWAYDTYTDIALSIFAEYELMLGDEDSVTVGVGTVYDTSWGKAVVEDTEDLAAGDVTLGVTQEKYLAQTIVAADEALTEITDTYGFATLPLGVGVAVAMGDLSAGIDFQTRLVQGSDILNIDADGDMRAYEMPMFFGVNVGYELAVGDMTITPSVDFKWNNDFWKWGVNDDGDDWEYSGLVSGADYIGRPMSANIGVDVEGIAGMVDLSVSAGLGFGDGAYDHGFMGMTDADGDLAPTLADGLAAWLEMNDTAVDDVNDKILLTDMNALELAIGLTIAPPMVAGLTVTNDFAMTNDGLGFLGYDDDDTPPTLYGLFLNELTNDFMVEYDLMVGDAVACTFFGKLMYEQTVQAVEDGIIYVLDPLAMEMTEQASKAVMSYELGVKATVSF